MAATDAEALAAIDNIMDAGAFGAAGTAVVIEEWMHGEEASYFALSDGQNFVTLASAQDHKRVGDGDSGPNTGGMGAYSPAPVVDKDIEQHIIDRIIAPTVAGMAAEGRPFKGVLYAGLMITADGPKLIEYNCRFGDPECQVLMARLSSDLLPSLLACHHGNLDQQQLHWRSDAALLVVLAANGYPGSYRKLTEMTVPDDVEDAQTLIFHAGTLRRADGQLLANGGRVLGVTGLGPSIAEAQQKAYQAVDKITWPDGFCRRDIGWQAIDRSG
jgi:phosphoribosylamine--glycine ligase